MNDLTRRDALKAGGATVAAALLPSDVVQAAPDLEWPRSRNGRADQSAALETVHPV